MDYFATLADRVIDGTICSFPVDFMRRNHSGRAVCVEGMCKVRLTVSFFHLVKFYDVTVFCLDFSREKKIDQIKRKFLLKSFKFTAITNALLYIENLITINKNVKSNIR